MAYITDQKAAALPALAKLDENGRAQALADADRVYRYVNQNPWITDADLHAYADRNNLPPDQLNIALQVLSDGGRLLHIQETGV